MAVDTESRPLPELIGGLARDVSGLFRKEIELAKAEASEKLTQLTSALLMLGAGAVLALGALGVILSAIVTAVATLLVEHGLGATAANSIAAAIVGVVVALLAWLFVSRGLNGLRASNLKLDRTTTALGRDAATIREKM